MVGRQYLRVVKLGGSLLTWAPVWEQFAAWHARQAAARCVVVVGGGPWVELLRQGASRFRLDEAESHRLCLRAMSLTARLMAACVPEARLISNLATLAGAKGAGAKGAGEKTDCDQSRILLVLDAEEFLHFDEPKLPGTRLPANWSVTSDSIAARVAACLSADELVLLKSQLPPHALAAAGPEKGLPASHREALLTAVGGGELLLGWSAAGFTDGFFPQVARGLPRIRVVNLRETTGVERGVIPNSLPGTGPTNA